MMTAQHPRPTRLTPEAALRAAQGIAEELFRAGHIEQRELEDAAKDIAKHAGRHMDGYELAKTLDSYARWDCNLEMAEVLDGFSSTADEEIKAAQQEWATAHNIQPPFPVGTHVIARWGGQDYCGTIDEIYRHGVAQYAVKADGETGSSRMIVNFENVRAIDVAGESS
ncbi:hypothetical protein [Allomesorhizobium alhagi]|uniref:Uncharacterized protein n=1 Tax=Mesorhizobium alhagi CCNWXJ12-2 TaxID=1107882 RepID=H0HNL3_9HYPH|nr:hypothetical protein [Mesorhizobium alhagi]EHK57666.1 hypothetical protein MAXJ12_08679 [Mesorhizobium alhagi CCNWXJ12-2]